MGNKIAVGTEICADLPPLIDTSLDCSLCTIGFPQFGGRFGVSFYTDNFCPTDAVEPQASIWMNGWYTNFGQLKCQQPGPEDEPDPGLFVARGQFSSVGYVNPLTGRGSSHKFRFTTEIRPTSEYTMSVKWICEVLGPRSVWQPYSSLTFSVVEVLGPHDDATLPYRGRMYVPENATTYVRWKGETRSYPPSASPAKGDIYTTDWSRTVSPPLTFLPPPFPPNTPFGWAFMWDGKKWQGAGSLSRWDIERIRADTGEPIPMSRFVPISVNTSIAGFGDGITAAKFTLGLESMREGCGGGGNQFPLCGMWFPLKGDTHPGAWHTCFRVIMEPDGGLPFFSTIGADTPDCGKVFRVSDGTIQYGPFCGCDKVVKTVHGKWEAQKNDDLPCYFPEVVTIGVPGEDVATVQEIQTNGTGSLVVKQLDGGKIWACHGIATGEDPNSQHKCSLMDWDFCEVTADKVVATGSPYVYKLRFEKHKLTMWLHALRFPSDPIMPVGCGPHEFDSWLWWCVNSEPLASKTRPPAATSGPFKTLAECIAQCVPAYPKKWYCVNNSCGEYDYEPAGFTSGPHDTEADCQAGCQPPPPESKWWCLDGNCSKAETQPSGSTGPYNTEANCNAACSKPPDFTPGWYCVETNGVRNCNWLTADDPGITDGPFQSETECSGNCQVGPSQDVWICDARVGSCVQMNRQTAMDAGLDFYESAGECQANCNTDPDQPSNPYQGYYCVPETNPVLKQQTYTCISWGGTTGPPSGASGGVYSTLDDCVKGCSGPPTIPFWCVEMADHSLACGQAVTAPPATVSGPYPTAIACFENCVIVVDPITMAPKTRSVTVRPSAPTSVRSLQSLSTVSDLSIIERLKKPCTRRGARLPLMGYG